MQAWGYTIVDPISKVLACGDQGKGAMATIEQIVDSLKKNLKLRSEYLELRKKKCEYNHYDWSYFWISKYELIFIMLSTLDNESFYDDPTNLIV